MKKNIKKKKKAEGGLTFNSVHTEDAVVTSETPNTPTGKKVIPPVKTPNVFKMMKSFGKDLAKYVSAGAPNCSTADYKDRLLTCDVCPHLIRNLMRCGKCGCLVEHKAKWKTTTCPDNKWKEQDLTSLKAEAAKKRLELDGEKK